MSTCTPIHLFVDKMLWSNERMFSLITANYRNHTPGDGDYDCALLSVPCESAISRAATFPDSFNDFVFAFDAVVSYAAMTIVTFSGLFGNIINVLIFSRNRIANDSTNLLLLAISVGDLLSCLAQFILLVVCYICFFDASVAISGYNILAPPTFHHNRWLNLLSLDFISFLAVQRAGAVLLPFQASVIFSYRNTKITVFILGIVYLCTLAPVLMYSTPMWIHHPYFNKTISLHYHYHFGFTASSILEYELQYASNRYIIDLCITIFFISVAVIKIKSQSKHRASLMAAPTPTTPDNGQNPKSGMSTREQRVMRMSLTVCFITFVVYASITIGMKLIIPIVSSMYKSPLSPVIFFAGKLIAVSNCSFNFFLYMKMSKLYRDAFKTLFRRRV